MTKGIANPYVQRHVLKVTYGEIIEPEPGQDPLTK